MSPELKQILGWALMVGLMACMSMLMVFGLSKAYNEDDE